MMLLPTGARGLLCFFRYDGDVYRALFESTKLEPLNDQDVPDAYERYLQYILHPERKMARSKL